MVETAPSDLAGANGESTLAVLVVDGNEEHQILSVTALTRRGWRVRTADSGKQALQLAIANHFDAVLVGSKLRDANGVEVLRLLTERFPAVPKVIVVPPDGEDAALEAMASGATSYIVKTPRYTELMPSIVEELVLEARNRQRLVETQQIQAQVLTERKAAEDRLSQSETRLRTILRQASVLLWSTDRELRVTSAMGGGFRTLEAAHPGERGLTLFDYFDAPDEADEPIASHRRALAGETVATQIEWRGRTFEVRVEPLRSPDGAIAGTIGVGFDVSERNRAEERLRQTSSELEAIFRAVPDAFFRLGADGTVLGCHAGRDMNFLVPPASVLGRRIQDVLMPDVGTLFEGAIEEVVRTRSLRRIEYALDVRGEEKRFEARFLPLLEDQLVIVVRDVTDHHKAEAAVRESSGALLALFDAAPVAIYALDRQGTVMSWNPAAERIFGWTESEVIGRALPGMDPETQRLQEAVWNGDRVTAVEARRIRKDGTLIQVSESAGPLRYADGRIRGLIAVVEDVTERRAMERRLVDSQRLDAIDHLARFIAHELNTPLTSISLLTSAIRTRVKDSVVRGKLAKIDLERRRATEIIRELLALPRVKRTALVDTDLRSVVAHAVGQMARKPKDRVALEVDVGPQPAIAAVDPSQIQEVVVHLVTNGLDATKEGSVRVRIEDRPNGHAIVVADTGKGMTPDERSQLFEPFFTTKPHGEGIGLGLLRSRHIVAAHGGTIEVVSEPGKGSAFTVLLPRKGVP